jgi:hypothetical protein
MNCVCYLKLSPVYACFNNIIFMVVYGRGEGAFGITRRPLFEQLFNFHTHFEV